MHRRFDAIVVGGGPAGAIAALYLNRLGWRIALVEKCARHRHKTCGHCLNPRAFAALARAGVLDAVRSIAVGCTQMLRLHVCPHHPLHLPLGKSRVGDAACGLLVQRSRLDQLLIDHAAAAGVTVIQPACVRFKAIAADESQLEIVGPCSREQLRTPLVVGADGLGSTVARAAGLAKQVQAGRKFGFSFDLPCAGVNDIQFGAIEMFIVHGGYVGVVNQGDGRLHIAGLISSDAANLCREPLTFVRSAAAHHATLQQLGFDCIERDGVEQFTAAGPMPWRPQTVANAHVALIGDAAGYVEPFTGEGMTWAMQSAAALADSLVDVAPGTWNSALAKRFAQKWQRNVANTQMTCRAMAFALSRQRVMKWMFRAGAKYPQLTRHVAMRVVRA